MIIEINETFYIEKDNYSNHTLHEKTGNVKTDKQGNQIETTKVHGYFNSVETALECLTHINIDRAHSRVSIGKYIQLLRNERESLRKLVHEGGVE